MRLLVAGGKENRRSFPEWLHGRFGGKGAALYYFVASLRIWC